ncbi:relaxase/mobilization nuclease domain-containing protein [Parvimonas sp. D9]|nr:relaxase/mobilization nuclease domain-containing protein [Parvimonas sp. D9]MEB3059055.1 relaxase/mobilization nuclease domain-containing protein [Parvimonas sp. D9]
MLFYYQFDIDNVINKVNDWNTFLKVMKEKEYEIKLGKHISFKHKDKKRFTRSKTIGEDYTEEKIKERITNKKKISSKKLLKQLKKLLGKLLILKIMIK